MDKKKLIILLVVFVFMLMTSSIAVGLLYSMNKNTASKPETEAEAKKIISPIKPETTLPTVKPETVKPETVKPETVKPETVKPETVKPETVRPETVKPETVKPETVKPETVKPETTLPYVKPETVKQETTLPYVKPETVRQETTLPYVKQETVRPETTLPYVKPETVRPETTLPPSPMSEEGAHLQATVNGDIMTTPNGTKYIRSTNPSCYTTTGNYDFMISNATGWTPMTFDEAIDKCAHDTNLGGNGPCIGIQATGMSNTPWTGCLSKWNNKGGPSYFIQK